MVGCSAWYERCRERLALIGGCVSVEAATVSPGLYDTVVVGRRQSIVSAATAQSQTWHNCRVCGAFRVNGAVEFGVHPLVHVVVYPTVHVMVQLMAHSECSFIAVVVLSVTFHLYWNSWPVHRLTLWACHIVQFCDSVVMTFKLRVFNKVTFGISWRYVVDCRCWC